MTAALVLSTALALSAVVLLTKRRRRPAASQQLTVALVVLGDIGRSPRMMYHAHSLAAHGARTLVIAYRGSALPPELANDRNLSFVYVREAPKALGDAPRALFVALLPLRVLFSTFALLYALTLGLPVTPSFYLVQNPPAIPTLPLVQLVCHLTSARLVIDWHNTGYSMLALRFGGRASHPVVRLARLLELTSGRCAYAHLCVSAAMRDKLEEEANLRGQVRTLHDMPPKSFKRLAEDEAVAFRERLKAQLDLSPPQRKASRREALVVSATSWTADEDFGTLLAALDAYDEAAAKDDSLSSLSVVITGKGPLKANFETEVQRRQWRHVRARTAWISREDYARLLGAADLGISLHASSSGVDLPMKAVDMLGADLPVLALRFKCIDELVVDRVNGRTFATSAELAALLQATLVPDGSGQLEEVAALRRGISEVSFADGHSWTTWPENWDKVLWPLLQQ